MKYATTSGPDADALAGQARHRLSADEAAEREQALERYILDHISAEDPYLYRLYRATHTRLLRPRMASGHLQGQVLRMLTTMIQPRTVVEIGTFSGYSALSMAAGMDGASGRGTSMSMRRPALRKACSRSLLSSTSYSYTVVSVKISGSALNFINVPCPSLSPITVKSLTASPRLNF